MPSILELFKKYNDNKEITIWNGERSKEGFGQTTMDFVKAEANPNGPRVLFYKKLVTPPLIYGTDTPRISLKGTVDPPRSLSVASARYNDDATKAQKEIKRTKDERNFYNKDPNIRFRY